MPEHPLNRPAYARLLASARRVVELHNGEVEGGASVPGPTEAERNAIQGLLGTAYSPGARTLRVPLAKLDAALRRSRNEGLVDVLEAVGPPLRRRRDEERERERLREEVLAPALNSPLTAHDWYRDWLGRTAKGTVTWLTNEKKTQRLARAVRILEHVTADDPPRLTRQDLAARTAGDTKALEPRTPLATLVLGALAERTGLPRSDSAEAARALWEAHGVINDDLSSRVLVLGLPAAGAGLGEWLTGAAALGVPFQITLHQLVTLPITVTAPVVSVCENPAVLRTAAERLGAACPPLLCTEGWPAAAFHRLASAIRANGGRLRYHGDLDAAGVAMTRYAIARHAAEPWRMTAADYTSRVEDSFPELSGAAALGPTPGDPGLAEAMARHGRAVHEESVVDDPLRGPAREATAVLPGPEDARPSGRA
ncbi:TIGR02679 family protein [Nocardiopsis flavescens]